MDSDSSDFCADPFLDALTDAVIDKYDNVHDMANALDVYLDRPGWAYLVYKMGPPPSIVSGYNVRRDFNFCLKDSGKPGTIDDEYLIFMGRVWDL